MASALDTQLAQAQALLASKLPSATSSAATSLTAAAVAKSTVVTVPPLDSSYSVNFAQSTKVGNYDYPDKKDYPSAKHDITSRLASVLTSDTMEDNPRLCFMRIEGENTQALFDDLKNLDPRDAAVMQELLKLFTIGDSAGVQGYARFSITGVQDSRSEKMQMTQTVGDTFIATFTGREPHILGVQGNLIFDYDSGTDSWYHAFINAYEFYLRASRMAKHRCKLRLVFPDFQELVGYMINITTSHNSDSDTIVPFSFSMLIVDKNPAHAIDPKYLATQATKLVDSKTNTATPLTADQVAKMANVQALIPTSADYDTYNALATKISNGEELTPDELAQYNTLNNKINASGTAYKDYNALQQQQLSAKSGLSATSTTSVIGNANLTPDEQDQLEDMNERTLLALKNSPTTLTADQTAQMTALEASTSSTTLYRALKDKESSGTGMTDYEKTTLANLQEAIDNPTANAPVGTLADYKAAAATNSAAADAVALAKANATKASYNTATSLADSNSYTAAANNSVSPTDAATLNAAAAMALSNSIASFKSSYPDVRSSITAKKARIIKVTSVAPGVRSVNSASAAYIANMSAIGDNLYNAYNALYPTVDMDITASTFGNYQSTIMGYTSMFLSATEYTEANYFNASLVTKSGGAS